MAVHVKLHFLLLCTPLCRHRWSSPPSAMSSAKWAAHSHSEKRLPLEKSWFPLASSLKTSSFFPFRMYQVLPALCSAREWSFFGSCCLSPWSRSSACKGGSSFQLLSHLSCAERPSSHSGTKLHLRENMSIPILFTKFGTERHFPGGSKFSWTAM